MAKLKAKKSLGQNFLKDPAIVTGILEAAQVASEDTVLEIGPGTGVLTEALSPRVKKLTAIEIDHALVERLQKQFKDSKSVSILEGNILDLHLDELLASLDYQSGAYKIIANIPYYITAPIIRTLLSLRRQPSTITLMVQREVAERLDARPGDMSLLSVMAQYYASVEKKFLVPREAFEPVPRVDSAIIQILPQKPFSAEEDRKFFRIVRAGFSARRKTLANNLSSSLQFPKEECGLLLAAAGIREDARAQALSIADWEKIQKKLEAAGY